MGSGGNCAEAAQEVLPAMTLEQVVTQNLRALRVQKKFSQEKLAQKAGISLSYVSMLERGVRTPPLDTMEALAKALGVPPLALLQKPSR